MGNSPSGSRQDWRQSPCRVADDATRATCAWTKEADLTRAAEADVDAIIDYIAGEAGEEIAYRFAEQIDAELAQLAELGHSGVSREWVSPGLRLTTIGVYCVYFRMSPEKTLIVRVLHGSRDVSQIGFDEDEA